MGAGDMWPETDSSSVWLTTDCATLPLFPSALFSRSASSLLKGALPVLEGAFAGSSPDARSSAWICLQCGILLEKK